jgi:hypothetical protein
VYLRGTAGSADLVPAVSDVDFVIIVDDGGDPAAVHRRWERLARRLPLVASVVDRPRVHRASDLERLVGRSVYTIGLDGDPAAVARDDDRFSQLDRGRLLERPGLHDTTLGWRLLTGRERRPPEPSRSPQEVRLAAWLELLFYWKRAFGAIADPSPPHTAALCVKLVSESARIALWLERGERPRSRLDAIERATALLPDETSSLERIATVQTSLHRMPPPPLEAAVRLLARLSARIGGELGRQLASAGTTTVRLVGAGGGPGIPLCDWRAVVSPSTRDERLTPDRGDPGDLSALRCAMTAGTAAVHAAVTDGNLLVVPSPERARVSLRAVSCRVTDPVSFALLAGSREAAFVDADGWSAEDWARRAVAEHRRRLVASTGDLDVGELAGAARAALFRESLAGGEPVLPVTHAAALELLADRHPHARAAALRAAETLQAEGTPDVELRETLAAAVSRLTQP